LSYLLAWEPDKNIQDNEGLTPLHLAVKSVDAVESTRPVRFLLIRGADKTIQDNSNQTALDLVNNGEVKDRKFARELKNMLLKSDNCTCFDCFGAPTSGVKRNPTTLIISQLLSFTVYILEVFFIFPYQKGWAVLF